MLAGDGSAEVPRDPHGRIWWEAEGSLATLEPAAFSAALGCHRVTKASAPYGVCGSVCFMKVSVPMRLGDSIFGRDQKIRRLSLK